MRSAFCIQGICPEGEIEWGGRPSLAWFFHLSKPELIPVRHIAKSVDVGGGPGAHFSPRTKIHHGFASFR